MKILMAGFQHETNTFSPIPALYDDFVKADLWPKMIFGQEMLPIFDDMCLPSTGFMRAAKQAGHELVPLLWCSAEPSGLVDDQAFESIMSQLCQLIEAESNFDAVYLDLHGAMATGEYDDAEGELLKRVKALIPADIPVVVSLDFHANVSALMVEKSDLISIYRTYPHIDMIETGERAFDYLASWYAGGLRHKAFCQIPYLIPLSAQCTDDKPNKQLYQYVQQLDKDANHGLELALGFPPADIFDAGPAIVGYGNNKDELNQSVKALYGAFLEAEKIYQDTLLEGDEAIDLALGYLTRKGKGPVILADVQDNSGAGATSDSTGILADMINANIKGGVVAAICDAPLMAKVTALGAGQSLNASIGNHYGVNDVNVEADWLIEKVTDGCFTCTGDMYAGAQANVGGLACLRLLAEDTDIRIVISQDRFQCVDRSVFDHLDISLESCRILVLKSTVHFRADFAGIARKMLQVVSPGTHPCRLSNLAYQNLRKGVRLGPCGPAFTK
jgi:microcystin degradation protein MlrC